jgi:hypothetical protein
VATTSRSLGYVVESTAPDKLRNFGGDLLRISLIVTSNEDSVGFISAVAKNGKRSVETMMTGKGIQHGREYCGEDRLGPIDQVGSGEGEQ